VAYLLIKTNSLSWKLITKLFKLSPLYHHALRTTAGIMMQ